MIPLFEGGKRPKESKKSKKSRVDGSYQPEAQASGFCLTSEIGINVQAVIELERFLFAPLREETSRGGRNLEVIREQRGQRIRVLMAHTSPQRERVDSLCLKSGDPLAGAAGWYHATV